MVAADIPTQVASPCYVPPPSIVISSPPGGPETYTVRMSPNARSLVLKRDPISSSAPPPEADMTELSKIDDRLRGVEIDVAAIKTQLTHIPTKLNMWTAFAASVITVGGALWWVVQAYLGPILAKAAGM